MACTDSPISISVELAILRISHRFAASVSRKWVLVRDNGLRFMAPLYSLVADTGERFDYELAHPPFGKKSSMAFTNEEREQEKDDPTYNRQDFRASTSNKQLNFEQQIRTMLKTAGRAPSHGPDNQGQ